MMSEATAIAEALRRFGHELEVEWRVGERTGDAFVPGMPEEAWRAAIVKCEGMKDARRDRTTTTDCMSSDGLRKTTSGSGNVTWLYKNKIVCVDSDRCRVSVAKETVLPEEPPDHPPLTCTRHKERYSFLYKIWRLDFTRVIPDIDADVYLYELELELVDTTAFFTHELSYLIAWAHKLLDQLIM